MGMQTSVGNSLATTCVKLEMILELLNSVPVPDDIDGLECREAFRVLQDSGHDHLAITLSHATTRVNDAYESLHTLCGILREHPLVAALLEAE